MTTSNSPRRGRGTAIGEGVTWTARWSLRLLLVAAGVTLAWWLIGLLWTIVFPVFLAIILATVLWPPTALLRRYRFPPALAAGTVVLLALGVLAGTIALIVTSIAGSAAEIAGSAVEGIDAIQEWVSGPPLNLAQSQLDTFIEQGVTQVQDSIATIATNVLTGITSVASGLVTALLTLVLTFLFIKDGPRFLPWLRRTAGEGAGGQLAEVLRRVWKTVGDFIRTQAIVSLVDAVLIGAGLFALGVQLALPLAVLTFIGGFIPIVGAVVAGALGVLVALVTNGFGTAVAVLVLIVVVQQLEGNVLQPMLQSRSLGLHAAVVLLAVTAGGTLFGIAGAFLAVPVTAAVAVVVRYLGERVDERVSGGHSARVPPPLESVHVILGVPGQPTPDATVPDPDASPPAGDLAYVDGPTPPEEKGRSDEPAEDDDGEDTSRPTRLTKAVKRVLSPSSKDSESSPEATESAPSRPATGGPTAEPAT